MQELITKRYNIILKTMICAIAFFAVVLYVIPTYAESNSQNLKQAMFNSGANLNVKMKVLAGNSGANNDTVDTKIQGFKRATTLQSGLTSSNIVSTNDSDEPIYMWFENSTIFYYTEADTIYLPTDAQKMFYRLTSLNDISGLSNVSTEKTTNMRWMFRSCLSLSNITLLSQWDVSKVTNMEIMFGCYNSDINQSSSKGMQISDLTVFANWDVSKVTNMQQMFKGNIKLEKLDGMENWDITGVVGNSTSGNGFDLMFEKCFSIKDTSAIDNWEININQSFKDMFAYVLNNGNNRPKWNGTWISGGGSATATFSPATTKKIKITKNWIGGNSSNRPNINIHLKSNSGADIVTQQSNWIKNGDTWNYEIEVANDSTKYSVYEEAINDYESDAKESSPKEVKNNSIVVNNTALKNITINKVWVGDVENESSRPTPKIHMTGGKVTNDSDWIKNNNSTWTYTFKVLDDGTDYYVYEDELNGYTSDTTVDKQKKVENNEVTIKNTYIKKYDLTIKNQITGNIADENDEFEVTIKFFDSDYNSITEDLLIENKDGQKQLSSNNNEYKVILKSSDNYIKIKNLTAGTKYEVSQAQTDYSGYNEISKSDDNTIIKAQTAGDSANGELTENQTIKFTNNKESPVTTGVSIDINAYVTMIIAALIMILIYKKSNRFSGIAIKKYKHFNRKNESIGKRFK